MRELGLWNAEAGLEETFADIEALAQECKFSDCTHGKEPDVRFNERYVVVSSRESVGSVTKPSKKRCVIAKIKWRICELRRNGTKRLTRSTNKKETSSLS
jgi:hypothetical protein